MSEWISTEDGHPDLDQEVLVYSLGFVYFCVFDGRYKHLGIDSLYLKNITHWMPLPKPPTKL